VYSSFGLFINGHWRPGHQFAEVISPVTEKPLGRAPLATFEDTAQALDAAAAALPKLRAMGGFARADALHRATDEMLRRTEDGARMIAAETGKPIAQARREWALACDQFRWYAEQARRIEGRIVDSRVSGGRFEVTREPVGIAAAFTAWNFPAALPARKLAPALAAGCPVVLRPSLQTPGVAMLMVDCLQAADFPAGSVNLLIGTTEYIYTPIMEDTRVRKVSLTGSTRVGQQMIRDAAATVKKVSMELGGNAPLIIFDDADLDTALDVAVATKFANCGQVCVTPDRFFIHERLHDAFVQGFVERARGIRLGDGLNPDTGMGPLINARRLQDVAAIVDHAIAAGAKLEYGGQRPVSPTSGYFFEPTVLSQVRDDMPVFAEENFGPIAAITRFADEDEVMTRANASPMGLSAYAFTRCPQRIRRVVGALKAGMVGINSFALAASEVPFGGTGHSGMGREGGAEGIEEYLDTKLAQIVL